jgi:endo-1,4-beta-xylanase
MFSRIHQFALIGGLALASAGFLFSSCKKNNPAANPNTNNNSDTPTNANAPDTAGPLKTAAAANGFLFGIESDYPTVTQIPNDLAILGREANISTFGYEMKFGAIVQDDGSFNYTATDAQYNAVTGAGVGVFGHNLYWYANQNATYLNSIVAGAGTSGNAGTNLLTNGDFETWSGGVPSGWSLYNQTNGSFSQGTGSANVQSGTYSLQVNITSTGQAYNTQIVSSSFPTVNGHQYVVSFYIRAAASGGLWQLEAPYGVNYTGTQTAPTVFTQETYNFTGNGSSATIAFDMGAATGTYYIDDVSVVDQTAGGDQGSPGAVAEALDSVLKQWIMGPNGIVTRYAGRVKYWDVVNEPMSDGTGALRTSATTPIPTPRPSDWFFWADYLGREGAAYAFEYAHQADPNALLFVNDYNLETNTAKLDSLIAYVKEMQTDGAHIDGIGTEMHINYNTPQAGIDAAFQALAATGLKVKISELDIRINPSGAPGFATMPVDPNLLTAQANMYHYVVSSYIKNVPASQRFAITVWGIDDKHSWYNTPTLVDFPLLWDSNFVKKPAYAGVLEALQGK